METSTPPIPVSAEIEAEAADIGPKSYSGIFQSLFIAVFTPKCIITRPWTWRSSRLHEIDGIGTLALFPSSLHCHFCYQKSCSKLKGSIGITSASLLAM